MMHPYDKPPEAKEYIIFLFPIMFLINVICILIGIAVLQWIGY